MSSLEIRAYNVLFGDAFLIRIPDRDSATGREIVRHILIDVGNVLAGSGGREDIFDTVIRDILKQLRGRPVDLYVMSHEHLDHVKGLPLVSSAIRLDIEYAWLPVSAEPGYYKRNRRARRKSALIENAYQVVGGRLGLGSEAATPLAMAMFAANDRRSTAKCVEYLASMANRRTRYVHRLARLQRGRDHPFQEPKLKVLAPEKDTSVYYGRLRSPVLLEGDTVQASVTPHPGVDPIAFERLLQSWRSGTSDMLLEIDRAANNTSVVFSLEWRGWTLLFPGDAELKSWRTMSALGLLRPVDVLKVGHHGSQNATPPDSILDEILPRERADQRERFAIVSTHPHTYEGSVPHEPTLQRLRARVSRLLTTTDVPPGEAVVLTLPG